MLMQQHFAQLLHLPEVNFSCQRDNNAIRELLLLQLLLQLIAAQWVATITEFKPE